MIALYVTLVLAAQPSVQLVAEGPETLADLEPAVAELCARIKVSVLTVDAPSHVARIRYRVLGPRTAQLKILAVNDTAPPIVDTTIDADSGPILSDTVAHVAYGAVEELLDRQKTEMRPLQLDATVEPATPASGPVRAWRLGFGGGGALNVLTNGGWVRAGAELMLSLRKETVFLQPGLYVTAAYLPSLGLQSGPRPLGSHGVVLTAGATITPLVTKRFTLTLGPVVGWHGNWITEDERGRRGPGAPTDTHALSAGVVLMGSVSLAKRAALFATIGLDVLFPLNPVRPAAQPPPLQAQPPADGRGALPGAGITLQPGITIGVCSDLLL